MIAGAQICVGENTVSGRNAGFRCKLDLGNNANRRYREIGGNLRPIIEKDEPVSDLGNASA